MSITNKKISRRDALKVMTLTTAGAVLAATNRAQAATTSPAADLYRSRAAAYTGKFVIISTGNPEQSAPLIKGIEDANPGVKVEWRNLPSERFVELFTAAEVAGDQIDLMDLNGQDLRRYAVGNRMKDLSSISYKDRFRDVGLATYTIRGKLWALPRGGISGFPFLYNKKVLDQIGVKKEPETYDDLLAMAPDLKKAGIAPFVHAGKNIYLWPVWQFWAHGQTSGNKSVENTWKTLAGDMKFTDPEHVAALDILYKYTQDKMFIESVNSMDSDAAWLTFSQGKALFLYDHTYRIGVFRKDKFPNMELSLIPPLRSVKDASVKRNLPGGTGSALGIYAKIAPEREEIANSIVDLMTNDKWVKWSNDLNADPVSCNKNVQASDDELALKYAKECAPNQTTYLDWYWPPEITRAFQENQQAIVSGTKKPDEAAAAIQKALEDLYKDGYKFEI